MNVNLLLAIRQTRRLLLLSSHEMCFHKNIERYISVTNVLSKHKTIAETCVSSLPTTVQPFARLMRLDRPSGAWLLMWPGFWSVSLATSATQLPSLTTLSLFGLGAVVMRGAGCVVNDLWDKDFDRRVQRTKDRPLASNQLSTTDAVMLLCGLSGTGFLILLQFDINSIILGASSLSLVTIYPLFKRFTHWPQLVLGMTFNWGALLGWSVVTNGIIDWSAVLPLYTAGICWTLIYDTIYAHQDKADDLMVGIKSTAIKFGDNTNKWLTGFSALMCSSLVITGLNTGQCWPYYTAVSVTAMNLFRQILTLNINDREDCWHKFKQNTQIGWILFIGIVFSTYLKNSDTSDEPNDCNNNNNKLLTANQHLLSL
ncbi:4-hydroxybenzoate polyprenyltransferase, mitochondrial-like [Oppia nitens]|uniref:4-hydroxybenzoate polyprenyltransferase, mitochondrial-like n=1 Tax=Oppia nitens TaxID=1686743 RepID=UPI0023DBD419|nr:4-hydroxybenzoate polyprenyltransferase, mitochondrial-like [Oppia nitens]